MEPNLRGLFTKGSGMWKGSGNGSKAGPEDGSEDGSRGQGLGSDRVGCRRQTLQDNREICGAKALGCVATDTRDSSDGLSQGGWRVAPRLLRGCSGMECELRWAYLHTSPRHHASP